MKHLTLSLAFLLVLTAPLATQAQIPAPPANIPMPNWAEVFPGTNPSARAMAAMVYDAAAGKAVMFAGLGPNGNILSYCFEDVVLTR
jgi:hypothetical protein